MNPLLIPTIEEVEALLGWFVDGKSPRLTPEGFPTLKEVFHIGLLVSYVRALDAERQELRAQLAMARNEALEEAADALSSSARAMQEIALSGTIDGCGADMKIMRDSAKSYYDATREIRSLMTPEAK